MDEKKIEEAAFDLYKNDNLDFVCSESIEGFKAGAHWAIQEFLKELWHDAKEEPKQEKRNILVQYKDNDTSSIDTKAMFTNTKWQSFSRLWKEYIEFLDVTRWCYIDDILGGEK